MPRNTDEINKLLTATIAELGDNGPENLSIGRVALRAGLPLALVERL